MSSRLIPCLHDDETVRGAVIVCPGGAYAGLAPYEGEPVAALFRDFGFQAFTLNYRCAPDRYPAARDDLFAAIREVRARAAELRVRPDRIAVLGFSAGGHLAAGAGMEFRGPAERPDAVLLAYPVISGVTDANEGSFRNLLGDSFSPENCRALSRELQVRADTPPTFLFHTVEDRSVPVSNALNYAAALARKGVPFELHIYPRGPHGMAPGRCAAYPELQSWPRLAADWLRRQGW